MRWGELGVWGGGGGGESWRQEDGSLGLGPAGKIN
jgi:hypothetical protein